MVSLINSNGSICLDTTSINAINANCPPAPMCNASFTYTNTAVGHYNFINNSVIYGTTTYTWFFGDGNTSNLYSPTHIYNSIGNYTVTLVINSLTNNCKDTFKDYVTVSPCKASFTHVSTAKNTISFTNTSNIPNGATVTWYFGDGTTSSQNNPTHLYNNSVFALSNYTVSMVIKSGTCTDSIFEVLDKKDFFAKLTIQLSFRLDMTHVFLV